MKKLILFTAIPAKKTRELLAARFRYARTEFALATQEGESSASPLGNPHRLSLAKTAIIFFLTSFITLFAVTTQAFQPLPVEKAFVVSESIKDNHTIEFKWQIAAGYHLYRDQFTFNVRTPSATQLGTVNLPPGIPKEDDILGKYQEYINQVTVDVPLKNIAKGESTLVVGYQGCADSGFCYPPISQNIKINDRNNVLALNDQAKTSQTVTDAATAQDPLNVSSSSSMTAEDPSNAPSSSSMTEQDRVTKLLAGKNWFLILLGFFGFGFLMAFTPCVLPMIPILSGIIVGQGKSITTMKAFLLSLTYVLAMAVTYSIAGVLAGLAGSYLQAFLQSPWVISIFAGLFVLLALSLFGFYELRIPNSINRHFSNLSNQQTSGTYIGVAIMGMLSTLIMSPCVTAPLIGALSYISQTGNAFLGGSALFTMGLGAGIPLMVVGTTEGKFLPKSGSWMNTVKIFFGVLLLGAAIWILQRILDAQLIMVLWAALLIISAVYMGVFTNTPATGWSRLWKGSSLILLVYGLLLLIGAAMGNSNPLEPLAIQRAIPVSSMKEAGPFKRVKSLQDLTREIDAAKSQGKPVILDFYADWCISCKEMDRFTFSDSRVQNKLSQYVLLRADVTANDDDDRALEKHFNVIAPPSILFFNEEGNELTSQRIVGEVDAKEFLKHIQLVLGQCGEGAQKK